MNLKGTPYRYYIMRFVRRRCCVAMVLCVFYFRLPGQVPEIPAASTEQQLENITENNGDAEIEDDNFLQQMQQYSRHPLNLNTASQMEIQEFPLLNALQAEQLVIYRKVFGKFISIYELQAIPSWNINLVKKLLAFITLTEKPALVPAIKDRLLTGGHNILVRTSRVLERSKGYLADTLANYYPGAPEKLLFRYKYQFKNLLQYGVLGEKDAGEQFFKGNQKQGFDFYSFHAFIRDVGHIRALALGDFTVNMGQGLIQWQGLAFKKSSEVINIKKDAAVLGPYNSAGETRFHRGAGLTIKKGNLEMTGFVSYKKIDGNFVPDTSLLQRDYISSLQTSGYHRTAAEIADKGIQHQLALGANISYRFNRLHTGINAIGYKFSIPFYKPGELYNIYAMQGTSFGNYSIDYSYTYHNMHLFGETAITSRVDKAFITGMLISTSTAVDMSFLYRNISKGYRAFYANAFTENSFPENENGFYAGLSVHPGSVWQLNAYADFFKFPWLKFGADAPAPGSDYMLQLIYKPNKQVEIYSRFRSELKFVNNNSLPTALQGLMPQTRQSLRTQFFYKPGSTVTLRSRVELLWFDTGTGKPENGFLIYSDVFYKPVKLKWAANMRVQYFETETYNSRLYAYENDVLYAFGIPVFFDKGARYYINLNYDVNKKIGLWLKWSQIVYANKTLTGSGLDEIKSKKRSEIKLQILCEL